MEETGVGSLENTIGYERGLGDAFATRGKCILQGYPRGGQKETRITKFQTKKGRKGDKKEKKRRRMQVSLKRETQYVNTSTRQRTHRTCGSANLQNLPQSETGKRDMPEVCWLCQIPAAWPDALPSTRLPCRGTHRAHRIAIAIERQRTTANSHSLSPTSLSTRLVCTNLWHPIFFLDR